MSKYYNESKCLHVDDIYNGGNRYEGKGQVPKDYVGMVADKKGHRVMFAKNPLFETTAICAIFYSDEELERREKEGWIIKSLEDKVSAYVPF